MGGEVGGLTIALLLMLLLMSAFFSSAELAFISLPHGRVRHWVEARVKGAERLARIVERPEHFLSTVVIGNNIAQNAAVSLATVVIASMLSGEQAVLVATVVMTIVLVVFCEVTPKIMGVHHASRLVFIYARPIEWISFLLSPAAAALGAMSSGLARRFGEKASLRAIIGTEELRTQLTIAEEQGLISPVERKLLDNCFQFGQLTAESVMTPRTELVGLPEAASVNELVALFGEQSHAYYPVYRESLDDIIGVVAIGDAFRALGKHPAVVSQPIASLIRPAMFVPETKAVGALLTEMVQRGEEVAVLIDEHGGTAGMVTFRKLTEEIVGEFRDQLTVEQAGIVWVSEGVFSVDAQMRLDEINEALSLELPVGDYETIAGLVLARLGRVPQVGDSLTLDGVKLQVTKMRGVKIERLLLSVERQTETVGEP